MNHPNGSCDRCGHRLYRRADGDTYCPNCEQRDRARIDRICGHQSCAQTAIAVVDKPGHGRRTVCRDHRDELLNEDGQVIQRV